MGSALVVFPQDTELNDALRDLDDFECGLVLGVALEEGSDGSSELVAGLLELGFRGLDHFEGFLDRGGWIGIGRAVEQDEEAVKAVAADSACFYSTVGRSTTGSGAGLYVSPAGKGWRIRMRDKDKGGALNEKRIHHIRTRHREC